MILVSCLYDIGRVKSEHPKNHTPLDDYVETMKKLLAVTGVQFVIFTENKYLSYFTEYKNVIVFCISKEYFLPFKNVQLSRELPRGSDPKKDTPEFMALTQSKFFFLQFAMKNFPDEKFFGWIDIGISKVAENIELLSGRFWDTTKKVRMMMLNWISERETSDRKEFYSCLRYKIAGGFFYGPRDKMEQFTNRCITEILTARFYPSEEQAMAYVFRKNINDYDYFVSDFRDIVTEKEDIVRINAVLNAARCANEHFLVSPVVYRNLSSQDPQFIQLAKQILLKIRDLITMSDLSPSDN